MAAFRFVSSWEIGLSRMQLVFGLKWTYSLSVLRPISLFCAICIGLVSTPATACRNPANNYSVSVVRTQLPAKLPVDAFVARIEIERPGGEFSELAKGVRVRVTRVLQGTYLGVGMIVRGLGGPNEVVMTSCASYSFGGPAGYIIGRPVGYENGVLVIQPEFLQTGPRSALFDLPDLTAKPISLALPVLRRLPALPRSAAASPRSRRAR